MSDRLNISPTKSSLLDLKRRLDFLQEGYRLLERKRELLTRLVSEKLKVYRELNSLSCDSLRDAYHWLHISQMRLGNSRMKQLSIGMPAAVEANILPRRNMGVQYPSVEIRKLPLQPVGILGTDASLDETRSRFADMVVKTAQLAEIEMALWRLLEEQRKTQKRVNALKYNVIPRYQRTIEYISASLEEEERNNLFQLKVLAKRKESSFNNT